MNDGDRNPGYNDQYNAGDADGAVPQLPLDIPLNRLPRTGRQAALALRLSPLDVARLRLVPISCLFIFVLLIVSVRLVDATLLQPGKNPNLAFGPGDAAAAPLRADITDRRGELLATSLPAQSLYADPKKLIDASEAARELVRTLPDLRFEEVRDKLASGKRFVWLKRNLTPDEVLKVNALGQPGLEFETEQVRFYPAGPTAAHVVGFADVDGHGLGGVERGLNGLLAAGGAPVALSLDMRLQHILKRRMNEAISDFRAIGGAGMIMDIKTGEMLAAISLPDFNPQDPSGAPKDAFFNRFAIGTYELGSVFKIFTIAAGLDAGRFTLDSFFDAATPIRYGRFTINDFHPEHRPLSTAEVFIYSSNIGAARMAMSMGAPALREFLDRLGLTGRLRTEISEHSEPLVPAKWADINAMTISFGHGISVTPLHFIRAMAAVMNGGHLVTPTFLKRDAAAGGGKPLLAPDTVDKMRRLMRANVVLGSGKSAEVPGYYIGGKTGTAEKTTGKRYSANARLSSFVGAFPMQDPRYLIYVMIDEPQASATSHGFATGGWVAAPVIGKIVADMAPLYGLSPVGPDDADVRAALSLTVKSRSEQLASF